MVETNWGYASLDREGGYGCPLGPITCCGHEGGLDALTPDWALCFLQPTPAASWQGPPFLSPCCLWRTKLLLGWLVLGQTSVSESLP